MLAPGAWATPTRCNVTNSSIAFGAYNPLSSQNDDTNSTLQIVCTANSGTQMSLSITVTTVLTGGNRTLSITGSSLSYNLYLDTARSVVWGDGTSGTSKITDSFTGSSTRTYTYYGRIFGGQNTATSGSYSSTLTVTVTY
jgi:spore coat protein U-like protein